MSAAQCATIQNTFIAPGDASGLGAVDSLTGTDIVDFPFLNGNLGRDAGRGAGFYKVDISLKKTFRIPNTEHMSLEIRADAFNVFNHPNWEGFNGNNDTNQLVFSLITDKTAPNFGAPAPNFFTCTSCMRPNGTLLGTGGQVMHLADIQHGKLDANLGKPVFGGIGDPTPTNDFVPRTYQLSFHFRF